MSHLFDLGYERIAIITGPPDLSTGVKRFEGYHRSYSERGIIINEEYIYQGPVDKESGYKGTRRFIDLSKRPQAIFAGNDYIAMGVLDALDEVGLRFPENRILMIGTMLFLDPN